MFNDLLLAFVVNQRKEQALVDVLGKLLDNIVIGSIKLVEFLKLNFVLSVSKLLVFLEQTI
jgi:hypothetical protein